MHKKSVEHWTHDHTFSQDKPQPGEKRTLVVIGITAAMMAVEVAAGLMFSSMALLADGLHMASHASALAISAIAYRYTRRHARDPRFNFGTGKVNFLAAFASAVLLVVFALIMGWESVKRLFIPLPISFNQAIFVAILGLAVNGMCLLILRDHDHQASHEHEDGRHHRDHNLWSAYLHVLADALTSVLAVLALAAGKYLGWIWMDPMMGILGTVLVSRWSLGLIRSSSRVLLDMRPPAAVHQAIQQSIERQDDNRVTDLHVWAIGPNVFAAAISIVTSFPQNPDHYCNLLSPGLGLEHISVSVHTCPSTNSGHADAPAHSN